MDSVYFGKPLLLLVPLVLLLLLVLLRILKMPGWLTAVTAAAHAAGITVLLLSGGDMTDVLVLVLVSGLVTLLLSPVPAQKKKEGDGR